MSAAAVMIDVTHDSAGNVPAGAGKVALYVTGSASVRSTAADRKRFTGTVVTIDQSPDGTLFAEGLADVLDVEPRAATDQAAASAAQRRQNSVTAVKARQAAGYDSTIYVSQANLDGLRKALSDDKDVRLNKVAFWVANWDLSQAEAEAGLGNEIVAIQWASPTSNPDTLLPGTKLTLAQANADLSVTLRSWYPEASKAVKAVRPKAIRKAIKRAAVSTKTASGKEPVMTSAAFVSLLSGLLAALQHSKGIHLSATQVRWVLDALVALGGAGATAAVKQKAATATVAVIGTGVTALATTVSSASPVHVAAWLPAVFTVIATVWRGNVSPAVKTAETDLTALDPGLGADVQDALDGLDSLISKAKEAAATVSTAA